VRSHRWLVRYIYVPTGGNKVPALSVTLTFLFVAVWHDVEPKLVAWGLLNALFFVVEKFCMGQYYKVCKRRGVDRTGLPARLFEGCCAGGFIFVLMAVNVST
jgi:D-alanyl-lipoteichoic acid acyltransferase DltB (MBOAT superfamily)